MFGIRRSVVAPLAALCLLSLTAACSSPTEPTPPPDAPTLTCPADIAAVSNDAKPVVVSYTLPTAVGGTEPVSVACAPPSGSPFEPGTTSVRCTATDRLARTATCGFSVKVSVPPRLKLTHFMAFGDSLTEGKVTIGALMKLYDFPGSYPSVLYTLLAQRYVAQTVTMSKQGLGGEPTATGVQRLQGLLATEHPEVLLLLDGANDLFGGDPASLAPAVSNMRTMVTMAKGAGATVLLAELPPQRAGLPRAGGAALVPTYNLALTQVAATTGATLVDLYTALSTDVTAYVGNDGLHLTAAGYQKVADTFFTVIQATLEIPGTPTASAVGAPALRSVIPEPAGPGNPGAINRNPLRGGSRKASRR